MATMESFKGQRIVNFAKYIMRNRWYVIILTVLFTLAAGSGGRFIGFDTNYRVFFGKNNPQLIQFEKFQNVFTKSDNVLIVVKSKSGEVFERDILQAIQGITKDAWQTPFSTRVDSITNFQHTFAEDDDLIVIDLVEKEANLLTPQELREKKKVALNDPLLINRLISEDSSTTGVNITLQIPGKSPEEVRIAAAFARDLIAKYNEKYGDRIEFALSGTVMLNNAFAEISQRDLATLVPFMYLMLIIGMIVFLRSFTSTFGTVAVIGLATMTAMGLTGWTGIKLTPPSSTAPTIILTLAIADSIHFLKSMMQLMKDGMSKQDAIVESLRLNFIPIFLTSLTTVIGFLSLNSSDAPPFRDLGNITAMGVTAAFLYSVTFLPALMRVLPVKVKEVKDDKSSLMKKHAQWVNKNFKTVLTSSLIAVVALTVSISNLELNDEFAKYFDSDVQFRQDTDFMMDNLTGIYILEFPVNASGPQGVNDPKYLQTLENFSKYLKEQKDVIHVFSVTDIMKRLYKNMNGDDPSYYRIPDNRQLASQFLLLYELSLPFGLDLTDRINVDKSTSRVSVTMGDVSSTQMQELEAKAIAWLDKNAPEYMKSSATGAPMMFSHISRRNVESTIKGNIIAFVLISLSIGIALGSWRLGLISLIPNFIPVLCTFGVWGLLAGQVNMAVATVAAVSLGIIVDDTVHLLSKFQRGLREKGYDVEQAIEYAFHMTGAPLVVTTIILVIGFSILTFSSFEVNASMGSLNAIAIGIALVMDFLLLPALLVSFKGFLKGETKLNNNVKMEVNHAS